MKKVNLLILLVGFGLALSSCEKESLDQDLQNDIELTDKDKVINPTNKPKG